MTDYPLSITERTQASTRMLTIPAPFGVPEVDAQIDLIAAVQGKQRLAVDREQKARAGVREAHIAARRRLVESMSTADEPDLSGDAEVTKAELTAEAARRITEAANAAIAVEVSAFFRLLAEHRDEVRQTLWKKAEKARETLAGAAMAAERAHAQLQGSAALIAGLDRLTADNSTLSRFAPAPYGGSHEASKAASATKEALAALNEWMERVYEPGTQKLADFDVVVD